MKDAHPSISFDANQQFLVTIYDSHGREISVDSGKVKTNSHYRLRFQTNNKGKPHPFYWFHPLFPALKPNTPYRVTGFANWSNDRFFLTIASVIDESTGELVIGSPSYSS